ncbi:hypothetical protein D3C81_1494480 [compost metagenome]
MVVDHQLAAPARVAACQVGLAVAIDVEQLGDFRFLQVGQVLDVISLGGLLIDQVALQHAGDHVTGLDQALVTTDLLVEVVMQLVPEMHGEVRIAVGQRDHHRRVVGLLGLLHVVTQLAKARHRHLATETLLGNRREDRRDRNTLPRLVRRSRHPIQRHQAQGDHGGALQKLFEEHRRVPLVVLPWSGRPVGIR